jgi:hypothetical protein
MPTEGLWWARQPRADISCENIGSLGRRLDPWLAESRMGRLNRALSKRVWPTKKVATGLSHAAAKVRLDLQAANMPIPPSPRGCSS